MNPIIFNSLGFTAEQIGSGVTAAALTGILTRLWTGYFLDKKYSYKYAIKISCLIALVSDCILFYSESYSIFLFGQFFLGAAAGIYWPSIELAIPLNCGDRINSSEGYAIARSADAIGVTIGVLIGTIGTYLGYIKVVYFLDFLCMFYIYYLLTTNQINYKIYEYLSIKSDKNNINKIFNLKEIMNWLYPLLPLLSITLFITGVMTLLQSFLAIDLANGGIIRLPLRESQVAKILSLKLFLIAIFQWPIGYIISKKKSSFKFQICLISLLIGLILLSLSNFLLNADTIIISALIPITISLCIFLPSAADAIVSSTPSKYQGSALALYSQCFGVSSLTVPWMAGKLIDNYDTAFQLWIIVSLICIILIPITRKIK